MSKHYHFSIRNAAICLALLAAAVGIAGSLYLGSRNKVQEVSVQEEILETVAAKPKPTQPVKPTEEPPTQPTEPSKPKPIRTAAPVDGEMIGDYAMDCLSYNETTRDWRTHNGIDLAAPEGTDVLAAAEGTVYQVFSDDSMGYTVAIRHEGGYVTQYSNLADDVCVAIGDTVKLGQKLGTVGATALVETAMGSHVHFSVSCQGKPMNPDDFLAME